MSVMADFGGERPVSGLLRWTSFAPFRYRRSSRRRCLSALCYSPRSILRGPKNLGFRCDFGYPQAKLL